MNFNLFPVIAASAISASVVLPAHAHADSSKASATHSYTEQSCARAPISMRP
ncbi:hypothetical protein [Pseudomonas sp. PNP]|uniref:hypothetical protein n=1 Tax=Pseudomonas sp. PNP TaxID=361819 RepID=UPI001AECEC6D|nr:hypothetical protein [Pseudomonas sp. PNP]MBP2842231.1 hypothetical protein [Pseudomonas sp. PNP]